MLNERLVRAPWDISYNIYIYIISNEYIAMITLLYIQQYMQQLKKYLEVK